MHTMIAFAGEQPIPNAVPVKHYSPEHLVLAHTDRTKSVARRIANLFKQQTMKPLLLLTEAYNVAKIITELREFITEHKIDPHNIVFNLTGGTKPMEFAALELARDLQCQAFYYQSDNNQSIIWPYKLNSGKLEAQEPIPATAKLGINEVLSLFVDNYHTDNFRNSFESQVADVLGSLGNDYEVLHNVYLDSVGPNIEIDWILCYNNTLAVGEVKQQAKKTDGIDQINGVTDQRTLGTYTKKFIISAEEPHSNDKLLAQAYRIEMIVVPSAQSGDLNEIDKKMIASQVRRVMENKS